MGSASFTGRLAIGPLPRDSADFDDIGRAGFGTVVTLMPDEELARLGASKLGTGIACSGAAWLQLPVVDMTAPDGQFAALWERHGPALLAGLNHGGAVLLHCRAGRGRSGTVAARLLIDAGMAPEDAIRTVRAAVPEAIETAEQEDWLRSKG